MATTPLDAETESLRAMMARQVEQLVHLIDDLIDVSRISRGKIKLRREPVDLTSVIEAAVEASQSMIKENGQTLRIETDSQRLVVYADPSRITQVVSNLLNNAAKYSDEGSRIELSVARQESEAVIVVRDDGIGIDPAELSTIFQMFSQIDTSIDRGQAGLGIGLTLVKSFVEMHGGEVTASSEGRGKGSVFTVRLPLSEKPLAEASRPQKVVRTPGRSFRVLVIDDQAALRLMLSKLVEKLGHQVESVSGGDEALASLGSFAPEVVISDISMPGMSGYELVRRLRSLPGAEGVYVVAMTGYGQATDRQAALDAGFDEHMVKPADMAQLEGLFARLSESWGKAE